MADNSPALKDVCSSVEVQRNRDSLFQTKQDHLYMIFGAELFLVGDSGG